ncbi:hypothetical protein WICPIJ_004569 [Wickerhamomyces pijperi]|uniref:Uncharacterized protein n=1 Tax=Wickerhamomyces pijperi TaxID=599730 RepID=A0A9P8Q7Q6_WICPI|nr:hypothetical protein WICPIJ_004569 [Wickerhamomyces pijperi]
MSLVVVAAACVGLNFTELVEEAGEMELVNPIEFKFLTLGTKLDSNGVLMNSPSQSSCVELSSSSLIEVTDVGSSVLVPLLFT